MEISSKSNNSVVDSSDTNINLKLRRLKIEESLLWKSILKTSEDFENESDNTDGYLETKKIFCKLRSSFIEVRDLFEEVKTNINSQDMLQTLDVEIVKKDVLDLETKMKVFKTHLQSQLKSLKLSEKELVVKIDENPNQLEKLNRRPVTRQTPLKQIVPSPVKNLICSPLKCQEIQQFQEFMANSKNRYGGWILYNHNIFEKTWHKYYGVQKNIEDYQYAEGIVENSEYFQTFLHEVCHKIPGTSVDEVITHNKWYTKYVYLKERQQRALEKWRANKRLIQNSRRTSNIELTPNNEEDKSGRLCKRQEDNIYETIQNSLGDFLELRPAKEINRSPLAYRDTTEQWSNRCKEVKEPLSMNMDIKTVMRRRVPEWRILLHQTEY